MTAKLANFEAHECLNYDETPFRPFKNRGRVIIEKSAIGSVTWKERDPKLRITFAPVVQFSKKLGFKPCFVVPVKQTMWKHKPLKTETKTVKFNGHDFEMLRKEYSNFVTYYRTKSWINTPLHEWEMSRLSNFLKKKFPNTKFSLMLDNVASHSNIQFQNLKVAFLPPNSTASLQPLDTSIFGTMKNKYASWLMRETLEKGPENLKLEDCVRSFADVFWNMDVRSVNDGFKKTGLSKFQSEPVLETPLSREEQVMNLIERFDRFQCSDSDDE